MGTREGAEGVEGAREAKVVEAGEQRVKGALSESKGVKSRL